MREARRQPDRAEQDHRDATQSEGGLREDLVTAFALSVVVAVAGLFLIAAFVWTSRAFAEASAGVDVGGGEVSVDGGEVYAGDGCVKAGDVVVGDCDNSGDGSTGEAGGGGGDPVDTPPTTMPEMTSQEMTSQEMTSQEEEEDTGVTTQETTAPEATSTEETTDPETTEESTGGTGLDQIIPPPTVVVSCPTGIPAGRTHEATVTRVVDGDTFEISGEIEGTDLVRLTGVDSPEMDSEGKEGGEGPEPGAEEAKVFSAEVLEGEDVVLETDEDATDDYGRLLAYVWTESPDAAGAETAAQPGEVLQEARVQSRDRTDVTKRVVDKELKERGLLSELKRLVGVEDSEYTEDAQGNSGMGGTLELFNAALLEAGHADVLTVEPNDAYAGCFESTGKQAEQGEAAGKQYAPIDEQYTDEGTTVEETTVEQTVVEETDAERSIPREPQRTTAEETTSQLSETTMESTQPIGPPEPVEETTSGESAQPIMEETTDAPNEQYDAPSDTGNTVPEDAQPETTPEAAEETTSAVQESATQPEAAPPAEISLDPPAATAEVPATTEETPAPEPVAKSVPEPPAPQPLAETYTPSVTATETGSLPTVPTSEGPITVLPDTGGPSLGELIAPFLGAVCVGAGTLGFLLAALLRARSRRDPRPVRRDASEPR